MRDVVRHVATTGRPFDLPDHYEFFEGAGDEIDPDAWFEIGHLCTVTRSEFARHHGVHRSQVAVWISRGLPVRNDGRISIYAADTWLAEWRAEDARRLPRGEGGFQSDAP